MNKLVEDYKKALDAIYDHVGFKEDWVICPLDDCTEMFWEIDSGGKEFCRYAKTIKDITRQRQRHWFVALKRKAAAVFGLNADLKQAFEKLIAGGIIPVSRST